MNNCKQKLTIRNLINSLNDIMTRSSNINLDSEIIIANAGNWQEFGNIRIYPIKDVYYGQNDKVGIYIQPIEHTEEPTEDTEEISKVIKEDLSEEPIKTQEPQEVQTKRNDWWEKYR